MEDLDAMKALVRTYRNQLKTKQNQKQKYLDKANEIKAVYDRLATDKKAVIDYKNNLQIFIKEKFDTFKGKQYSLSYLVGMSDLLHQYETTIERIDTNMDRLNDEKTKYQNLANNLDGPIGRLKSLINTLTNKIVNWIN